MTPELQAPCAEQRQPEVVESFQSFWFNFWTQIILVHMLLPQFVLFPVFDFCLEFISCFILLSCLTLPLFLSYFVSPVS